MKANLRALLEISNSKSLSLDDCLAVKVAITEIERLRRIEAKASMLLCLANGVTVWHRHGQEIPKRYLDALSNYQMTCDDLVVAGESLREGEGS